jgi:hypothetical protein
MNSCALQSARETLIEETTFSPSTLGSRLFLDIFGLCNVLFGEITALLSLHVCFMRERRMNTIDISWLLSVDQIYSQLMEHFSDRFTEPIEAINKATNILAKYYLNLEE